MIDNIVQQMTQDKINHHMHYRCMYMYNCLQMATVKRANHLTNEKRPRIFISVGSYIYVLYNECMPCYAYRSFLYFLVIYLFFDH